MSQIEFTRSTLDVDPFSINLFFSWMFDNYPASDIGGDIVINLYTNFEFDLLK